MNNVQNSKHKYTPPFFSNYMYDDKNNEVYLTVKAAMNDKNYKNAEKVKNIFKNINNIFNTLLQNKDIDGYTVRDKISKIFMNSVGLWSDTFETIQAKLKEIDSTLDINKFVADQAELDLLQNFIANKIKTVTCWSLLSFNRTYASEDKDKFSTEMLNIKKFKIACLSVNDIISEENKAEEVKKAEANRKIEEEKEIIESISFFIDDIFTKATENNKEQESDTKKLKGKYAESSTEYSIATQVEDNIETTSQKNDIYSDIKYSKKTSRKNKTPLNQTNENIIDDIITINEKVSDGKIKKTFKIGNTTLSDDNIIDAFKGVCSIYSNTGYVLTNKNPLAKKINKIKNGTKINNIFILNKLMVQFFAIIFKKDETKVFFNNNLNNIKKCLKNMISDEQPNISIDKTDLINSVLKGTFNIKQPFKTTNTNNSIKNIISGFALRNYNK